MASKQKKINVNDYLQHYTKLLEDADNQHESSLQRLQKVRVNRQNQQNRQLKRLLKTRDEEDPRVIKQKQMIAREQELTNYLNVRLDKIELDQAPVSDSYVLRGKIRGDNLQGLAGYKVMLLDPRGNQIGKESKTDKAGNYSLVVDTSGPAQSGKLSLVIEDPKKVQIHKDAAPVLLTNNQLETRDIVLSKVNKIDRGYLRVRPDLGRHREIMPVAAVRPEVSSKIKAKPVKKTTSTATPKPASPKPAISKRASPKKTSAKEAKAEKTKGSGTGFKKISRKKTTAKKTTSKKTTSKKTTSKKTTRKKKVNVKTPGSKKTPKK